jgi:hypothetical protein
MTAAESVATYEFLVFGFGPLHATKHSFALNARI